MSNTAVVALPPHFLDLNRERHNAPPPHSYLYKCWVASKTGHQMLNVRERGSKSLSRVIERARWAFPGLIFVSLYFVLGLCFGWRFGARRLSIWRYRLFLVLSLACLSAYLLGLLPLWPLAPMASCLLGLLPLWPLVSLASCLFGLLPLWPLASLASCLFGLLPLWSLAS